VLFDGSTVGILQISTSALLDKQRSTFNFNFNKNIFNQSGTFISDKLIASCGYSLTLPVDELKRERWQYKQFTRTLETMQF
jgi:hypothetical protein